MSTRVLAPHSGSRNTRSELAQRWPLLVVAYAGTRSLVRSTHRGSTTRETFRYSQLELEACLAIKSRADKHDAIPNLHSG